MSKQTSNKQSASKETLSEAERVLAELEQRRAKLAERRAEIEASRQACSYKAHAEGDAQAARLLAGVVREALAHDEHLKSLAVAIGEAQRRLQQAREHEALAADREQAKALRDALKQFVQHAAGVDSALEVLVSSCNGLQESLTAMHRCGSTFPSDAQLLSLGGRVLLGALGKTPFRRNFETLPPLERDRNMARIVAQWADTCERGIKERLGDQTNEAA